MPHAGLVRLEKPRLLDIVRHCRSQATEPSDALDLFEEPCGMLNASLSRSRANPEAMAPRVVARLAGPSPSEPVRTQKVLSTLSFFSGGLSGRLRRGAGRRQRFYPDRVGVGAEILSEEKRKNLWLPATETE